MNRVIVLLFGVLVVAVADQENRLCAIVRLVPHDASKANVTGELRIMQDGPQGPSHVTGRLYGLREGLHGFHVHEKGDTRDGCTSAGAHYNPTNMHHGGKNDDERHVGDLGNILANDQGEAHVDIVDSIISLTGPHGILGRSVVVHADVDDLGKGNHKLSLTTGNSGGRLACGIVAVL